MKKNLLDELKDRGDVFIDPCPTTESPVKKIIKVIGDIFGKK